MAAEKITKTQARDWRTRLRALVTEAEKAIEGAFDEVEVSRDERGDDPPVVHTEVKGGDHRAVPLHNALRAATAEVERLVGWVEAD
jgi:hypothetical protein